MGNAQKILMFSRDPGGANVVASLAIMLDRQGFEILLFGKDFSLSKYKSFNLCGRNLLDEIERIDEEEIQKWLCRVDPNVIITGTSADDMTEKIIWKMAKKLKINTIAVLDQWINYGIRFSKYGIDQYDLYQNDKHLAYLPDQIGVMDEYAKKMMVLEGVPSKLIKIIGNPYFEYIKQKYCLNNINMDIKDGLEVLFISEPFNETYMKFDKVSPLGYDELTIFKSLYKTLNKIADEFKVPITIKIRLHPKEAKLKYLSLFQNSIIKSKVVKIEFDNESDGFKSMMNCQLICGMSSMFLLEAIILKRPVISIQIGLRGPSPFVLDQRGVIKSILMETQLYEHIRKFVETREFDEYTWNLELNLKAIIETITEA